MVTPFLWFAGKTSGVCLLCYSLLFSCSFYLACILSSNILSLNEPHSGAILEFMENMENIEQAEY